LEYRDVVRMQKPLIVAKLGGAALTDKRRIYTPHPAEISRAAKQIANLRNRFSFIIVHGAGSYGHIPVERYGLKSGLKNPAQLKGLSRTKSKLLEWEIVLESAFLKQGVPLVPMSASDFVITRSGRIHFADLDPLRNWLRIGCIPSTGGDIVTDLRYGFSILSGDQLAAFIATSLHASRLIFATDVDGIFDSDPKKNPEARLIAELTASSALRLKTKQQTSAVPDVTGGMAGKIMEAAQAASKGVPVQFVNLTKNKRLEKAVVNQKVIGSKILPN
jgi:isopentenyl phosphate kinase